MSNQNVSSILVIGLNPSWQRVIQFDTLQIGSVNRAHSVEEFPSGKGINCAMAIKEWGVPVTLFHCLAGYRSDLFTNFLQKKKIENISIEVPGEIRTCQTIIDGSGTVTEYIEPGFELSAEYCQALERNGSHALMGMEYIAFCGTFPKGVPESFFTIMEELLPHQKLIIDGVKNIHSLLVYPIFLLKINSDELRELTGKDTIQDGWKNLKNYSSIENLIITQGADATWMCSTDTIIQFVVPKLETVLNPIGAGDVFMGVVLAQLSKGISLEKAVPNAIGAASAKCKYRKPWGWSIEESKKIRDLVTIVQ